MFPQIPDDDKVLIGALLLALLFGLLWWCNRRAKKWLEETGRIEESPKALEELLGVRQEQEKPGTPLRYSEQQF